MTEPDIRRATLGDARSIAEIYNHYVLNSTATFDTEVKTVGERVAWLVGHDDAHPVLVAESAGVAVAWGSLSPFHERPAYRHTVELGVYVSPEHTGAGIGPVITEKLIDAARQAGHHAVVSLIVAENEPSIKLAQRTGFETVGTMHQVGRKFDRWLDVVIMELLL